jgi:hypothetical protein
MTVNWIVQSTSECKMKLASFIVIESNDLNGSWKQLPKNMTGITKQNSKLKVPPTTLFDCQHELDHPLWGNGGFGLTP